MLTPLGFGFLDQEEESMNLNRCVLILDELGYPGLDHKLSLYKSGSLASGKKHNLPPLSKLITSRSPSMPAVVEFLSVIRVSRATTEIPVPPHLVGIGREEDILVVVVKFAKPCVFQLTSSDPMDADGDIGPIKELKMYLPFSNVKQTCNESSFRRMMKIDLTDIGVRERLQEDMFDKLFPVIYAAETCEVPIEVIVADVSIVSWDSDDEEGDDEEVSNFTPAAEDAVEGLEKVRLDADIIGQTPICGICRKDFALDEQEELVTRMPCSHCYHQDCIGRWLRVNHRCPLCRYSMPVETPDDDLECISFNSLHLD